jgi:hypothetical protein
VYVGSDQRVSITGSNTGCCLRSVGSESAIHPAPADDPTTGSAAEVLGMGKEAVFGIQILKFEVGHAYVKEWHIHTSVTKARDPTEDVPRPELNFKNIGYLLIPVLISLTVQIVSTSTYGITGKNHSFL